MRQESGRSMIEMLGVLAIMGVITVGAIGMISTAMRTQKLTTVNDQVVQMVTLVRSLHGEYDDFSNMNGAKIFGAIGMSNANPYGGTYELAVDPANPRQFLVTINGLSQSDCESLVAKAWSDSVGYQMSAGKNGGAVGDCKDENGKNVVQITYGE
ncbi:MAG: prepilin-type N-terminal cleavage/methylation domain-containing protein [Alphaproteobacteria bacterium]|nr:prepilin-type N-terminal cleavage/methylation domain-containing protein [Alphaproteobacteria bacterium]